LSLKDSTEKDVCMAILSLHGKSGEEDSLTSEVFGSFKYLPPSLGIVPFLRRARDVNGHLPLCHFEADIALYCFWPRARRREPDLFLLLLPTAGLPIAAVVEAKYRSGKHNHSENSDEAAFLSVSNHDSAQLDDAQGDQLGFYFDCLLNNDITLPERRSWFAENLSSASKQLSGADLLSGVPQSRKFLIYVTAHHSMPKSDILSTLDNVPREHREQILWLNWQAAASTLEDVLRSDSGLPNWELESAADALSVLAVLGLLPYRGWPSLSLDWNSRLSNPFFWNQRFIRNIETSGLKLGERIYFFAGGRHGNRS
jgi:hypothetical protein